MVEIGNKLVAKTPPEEGTVPKEICGDAPLLNSIVAETLTIEQVLVKLPTEIPCKVLIPFCVTQSIAT